MTTVVNLNPHPITVLVNTKQGTSYVHIAAKSKGTLSMGDTVDANWLATNSDKVRVIVPVESVNLPASAKALKSKD